MFNYVEEINLEKIKIESLTEDNHHLVKDFCCSNDVFEEFLVIKALSSNDTRTYLFIYDNEKERILLGYFSISASGISIMNDGRSDAEKVGVRKFNMSAIEISHFALCEQFQHMFWDEGSKIENYKFYLSDVLFLELMKYITNEVLSVIGAAFIVLYSVPKAENLYRRNEFMSFEDFMIPDIKRYLEDCVPLYLKIE